MKKNLFLSLIVLSFFVFGCGQSDNKTPVDKTKPTGEVINIPATVDQAVDFPVLPFEINFVDDINLKEYKIDIHDNFDGHSHGRRDGSKRFAFNKSYPMSGKTFKAKDNITIPKDAPTGPYHFIVKYFDAAGNEGNEIEVDFSITNVFRQTDLSLVFLNPPKKGERLAIAGQANDPDGEIEQILISVVNEANGVKIFEKGITVGSKSTSFQEVVNLSADLPSGIYAVIAVAIDTDGNYTVVEEEFSL